MKRIFVISGGLVIAGMIPLSMMSGGTKEPAKPLQLPAEKENVISPGKPIFIPVAERRTERNLELDSMIDFLKKHPEP